MQKTLLILAVAACIVILVFAGRSMREVDDLFAAGEMRVVLVEGAGVATDDDDVIGAWHSVLAEEGLPAITLDAYGLLDLDPAAIAPTVPAIILPDGRCDRLSRGFEGWLRDYIVAGGNLAVIYDPGTRNPGGDYRQESALAGLTGIRQIDYAEHGDETFTTGHLRFRDEAAARACRIPPGLLDAELQLSSYEFGALDFPVARSAFAVAPDSLRVLADVVCADGSVCPGVVIRRLGAGRVMYVNLPLGHLKAHGEDVPLRALLGLLLLDESPTPHLMPVPRGIGGVVWNWHVDSNADWPHLAAAVADSLLRETIRCSIHVTAGDGCYEPGDGQGFDACGAGRPHLDALRPFGVIGSHGGLHHNWFAEQLAAGALAEAEVRRIIMDNNSCLASVVDRSIDEYSAPVGVHPQPMMTRVLEGLDFVAYYYTGGCGAAPNRAFADGRMLSGKLISFPVMPFGKIASLEEMDATGIAPADVARWLKATSTFCAETRSVRLLYSHPYNLYVNTNGTDYRGVFGAWLDGLEAEQAAGTLQVRPMGEFAGFLLRMLGTEYSFVVEAEGLRVTLANSLGLQDVTVAVPRDRWRCPSPQGCSVQADSKYHYIVVEGQVNEATFVLGAL